MRPSAIALCLLVLGAAGAGAQSRPRARDLQIPMDGTPGPLNAITDVAGVEVGMTTLIPAKASLIVGKGPVRTGVTAILPAARPAMTPVYAAWFTLNGNGEMTGTTWVEESGFLGGPDHDHQYPQRRHRARRGHRMGVARRQGVRLVSSRSSPRPGTAASTTSTAFT